MKEVALIGATFYGNRGAEAMLSTSIGVIRESHPDTIFNVFTYYPDKDRQLVLDPRIVIYSSTPIYLVMVLLPAAILYRLFDILGLKVLQSMLPSSVQALARSRLLICLAGVSFVDGRTKFIPFNIATILPAMVLSVPVVKFSQAIGPFHGLLNRFAAKFLLPRCRQVFTRGAITQSYLESLCPDKHFYQRADDVVFLFRLEHCLSLGVTAGLNEALSKLNKLKLEGHIVIGVCPSVVVAKRVEADGLDYAERMRELIESLVKMGYAIALFPNATRGNDMNKTHNNDLALVEEIKARLGSSSLANVISFGGSLNAAQIHHIINACNVLAVSRFHAMVGALACGKPVIVIGWSHKYLEVMECFGQSDMVLDYKQGNVAPVLEKIAQLVLQANKRTTRIVSSLPKVKALSSIQFEYIKALLDRYE